MFCQTLLSSQIHHYHVQFHQETNVSCKAVTYLDLNHVRGGNLLNNQLSDTIASFDCVRLVSSTHTLEVFGTKVEKNHTQKATVV